jgi:L-alanine-DL-glutamate epimerase-like enolase superfamily enzyme
MTKIKKIDVYLAVANRPPAHGQEDDHGPVIHTMSIDAEKYCLIGCVMTTVDGTQGFGYGWSIGDRRGRLIAAAVKETAGLMLGQDALRTEQAWDRFWRFSNFLGHSGLAMMGMSILDMAMWDIRCRSQELPLWIALGGHKEEADTYSNGIGALMRTQRPSVTQLTEAALQVASTGHRTVKTWVVDQEQMDTLRGAIAQTEKYLQWAIDVVQLWDVGTAIRAIRSMEDLSLVWVEDPVPYDDLPGLAQISSSVSTPICSGENAYYTYEPRRLIDETNIRYIAVDLMRCGGISGWQRIAAIAEGRGVQLVSHTYPQVATHLVCGTRNAAFVEHYPLYDGWVGPPIRVADGKVAAPATPGIGIEFSESVLADADKEAVA